MTSSRSTRSFSRSRQLPTRPRPPTSDERLDTSIATIGLVVRASAQGLPRLVLCVGTDAATQQTIWRTCVRRLARQNVRVQFWRTEPSVLATAVHLRPDAIALDLDTTDLAGVRLLHDLRADDALAGVPILVSSTRPRELVEEAGAEALPKPFDPETFVAAVERALGIEPELQPAG